MVLYLYSYVVISLYSMFHNSFSVFTESDMNDNAATENVLVKALKHVLDDDSILPRRFKQENLLRAYYTGV